jgi:hypothetical protein
MEIGGYAQELSDVACDDARARGEAFPATFGEPTRNEEVRCQPEEQTVTPTGLTPPALPQRKKGRIRGERSTARFLTVPPRLERRRAVAGSRWM